MRHSVTVASPTLSPTSSIDPPYVAEKNILFIYTRLGYIFYSSQGCNVAGLSGAPVDVLTGKKAAAEAALYLRGCLIRPRRRCISEFAMWRHGPGRILHMLPDAIDAAASDAARAYARSGVTFDRLGAERRVAEVAAL